MKIKNCITHRMKICIYNWTKYMKVERRQKIITNMTVLGTTFTTKLSLLSLNNILEYWRGQLIEEEMVEI